MATHYNSPPIQEALIDIKVVYKEFELSIVEQYFEKIKDQLPNKVARNAVTFNISEQGGQSESLVDGYMFQSADGNKVLQITQEGFTFSLLNEYSTWELFHEESKKFWKSYLETLDVIRITRVGVRYVNKLTLPPEIEKLPEYVNVQFIPALDVTPNEIFTRYVLPSGDNTCIVTQATSPNLVTDDGRGYIIDIDVFNNTAIEIEDVEKLDGELNALREIKNSVFENSITDKTRGLIK